MINPVGTFLLAPTVYIRGGIGEFRNMLPPALLSTARVSTGLPNAIEQITCLGAAAPTPDWSAFAADPSTIPSSCRGASNPVFTDAAPAVQLFNSRYAASRSWRANLAVSSNVADFVYSVEGVYALNLDQPGIVDANFHTTLQFLLGDEGRPVYVPTSAIDATTGGVSNVPARLDHAFGPVVDNVSDLRSHTAQIMSTVSRQTYFKGTFLYMSLAYMYADNRAEHRGFDGATFGDPNAIEWSRGDFDIRHTFTYSLGVSKAGLSLRHWPRSAVVGRPVYSDRGVRRQRRRSRQRPRVHFQSGDDKGSERHVGASVVVVDNDEFRAQLS